MKKGPLETCNTHPSAMQQPIAVRISGSGIYLPHHVVPSSEFDSRWGKASGWTAKHSGVSTRHVASAQESSSAMAVAAATAALDAARLHADQLDCIVSACSVMEQAIPCLASRIQRQLGLGDSGVPAFDINATCLSFIVAFDQLTCAIGAGRFRRVLLVSSEMPSIGLNPDDQASAPLFGDGAAAVILEACTPDAGSALLSSHMETYGSGVEFCRFRGAGTGYFRPQSEAPCFEMDGPALYKLAARQFPVFMSRLLGKAGLRLADIALFVPHQASGKALDYLQSVLDVSPGKVIRVIARQGNQVAASVPSALHHALANGQVARGDRIALLGTGAGVSLGGVVLRY